MNFYFFKNKDRTKEKATAAVARQTAETLWAENKTGDLGEAQYVLAYGGDGTMLDALREMADYRLAHPNWQVPTAVGFNYGDVGYLMNQPTWAVNELIAKASIVTVRPLDVVITDEAGRTYKRIAFNDVVVHGDSRNGQSCHVEVSSTGKKPFHDVVKGDGVIVSTVSIPGNNVINLGNLSYGKYELFLTDDTNNSPSVSWIVADINVSAEAVAGGIINVSFSSKNASAIGVYWCDSNYMAQIVKDISEEDRVAGTISTFLDSTTIWANAGVEGYAGDTEAELFSSYYTEGTAVYVRVLFLTEYGVITSQWPTPVLYKE